MIAGVICGSLGLLSLIFAVLLCRRYNQASSNYYDNEKYYNQSPGINAASPDVSVASSIFLHLLHQMAGWDPGVGEDSLHSIPVHLFPKHVLDLHMNQEVGFAKEYEEIRWVVVSCSWP